MQFTDHGFHCTEIVESHCTNEKIHMTSIVISIAIHLGIMIPKSVPNFGVQKLSIFNDFATQWHF